MTLLQLAVIALVQGITEFLPISSSAHLRLIPLLGDWPDQGLLIDVAVHVGTLLAVIVYLRRDCLAMAAGLTRLKAGLSDPGLRMILYLVIATIPVVIAGYVLTTWFGEAWRNSLALIAWSTLLFGIALYGADRIGPMIHRIEHVNGFAALAIGIAQVLALIPGASRAGVTMTAARLLGYERRDAARFSMLLSIPTIIAAGTLASFALIETGDAALQASAVVAGLIAFVTALIAIVLMMGWLTRSSFTPFVVYRIILGGVLLGIVYL